MTDSLGHAYATGTPNAESAFQRALSNNKTWAARLQSASPDFLPTLAKGQSPKILWIGCSDSRVPAETLTGLSPGELFVTRNIANIVNPTDLSSLSVIEFAVTALKVQHIVLCGHMSCGGAAAALGNKKLGKIDTWLSPLRRLRMEHAEELGKCEDKVSKLVELNVAQGIEVLRENPDVMAAQKERGLELHGCVYDLRTGELRDLELADEKEGARGEAFGLA